MGLSLGVDELLEECGRLHGHLCPGQLLGVRMALLGCELVRIDDPKGSDRKRLFVWVEIDRCITDAVSAVTGVSLGRRTLKFIDYGKVAATFFNAETLEAVRVWARDDARSLADLRYPEIVRKKDRQMRAYSEALTEELFKVERVVVSVGELDAPGHTRSRDVCQKCREGVNDGRIVVEADGSVLCRACAGGRYYTRIQQ